MQPFPHPKDATAKIWLKLANWSWRYFCSNVLTTEPCYTVSSPCEPSAPVSWKVGNVFTRRDVCLQQVVQLLYCSTVMWETSLLTRWDLPSVAGSSTAELLCWKTSLLTHRDLSIAGSSAVVLLCWETSLLTRQDLSVAGSSAAVLLCLETSLLTHRDLSSVAGDLSSVAGSSAVVQ